MVDEKNVLDSLKNMEANDLTSLERQLISLLQMVRRLQRKQPVIAPKSDEMWVLVRKETNGRIRPLDRDS